MAAATLIITRPEQAAHQFVASLETSALVGIKVIYAPLLEIRPTNASIDLSDMHGVIFTSQQAVAFAPAGNNRTAYCVGATTTMAAKASGWSAHMAGATAAELLAHLSPHVPSQPFVHLSGTHVRGDISGQLGKGGWKISQVAVYDQVLLPLTKAARESLLSDTPTILPLFSPRTAAQLANQMKKLHEATIIALSDAVADPVRNLKNVNLIVAEGPNIDLMRYEVQLLCQNFSLS